MVSDGAWSLLLRDAFLTLLSSSVLDALAPGFRLVSALFDTVCEEDPKVMVPTSWELRVVLVVLPSCRCSTELSGGAEPASSEFMLAAT